MVPTGVMPSENLGRFAVEIGVPPHMVPEAQVDLVVLPRLLLAVNHVLNAITNCNDFVWIWHDNPCLVASKLKFGCVGGRSRRGVSPALDMKSVLRLVAA